MYLSLRFFVSMGFTAHPLMAFVLSFAMGLLGCGPSAPETHSLSESYSIYDGERLIQSEDKISGKGKITFSPSLAGLLSSEHFLIQGQLFTEDSEFIVHNHFSGFPQEDGLQIHLSRKDHSLVLRISTPGYSPQLWGQIDHAVDASGFFSLRLEIHHLGRRGIRVLAWASEKLLSGKGFEELGVVTESNAELDSRAQGLRLRSGGQGVLWGLTLEDAAIVQAFREAPYVAH